MEDRDIARVVGKAVSTLAGTAPPRGLQLSTRHYDKLYVCWSHTNADHSLKM